ncbi:MAG: DNA polymerase I [Oscillospiraceae bacterium]|jgi:DNA polymerase-1|nr:DNA polymerase I [Oscillospiraceae bacterium]
MQENLLNGAVMAVDGNSILNRAYYGVRPLSNGEGVPTHAVFGFLNILHRLLGDYKPGGLCVAFDLPAPTFRNALYGGYKAARKPMPDDLAVQIPLLRETLGALRVPVYELEGFEGDDVLGTIAQICADSKTPCVLVTGDRDSFQLIGEYVTVAHVGNKETRLRDHDSIVEEYGLTPAELIDLKALQGDASDQIPGVPGIGEKSALALMREFRGLDAIYASLDSVLPKFRGKLEAGKESAYLSRKLGAVCRDIPLPFSPAGVRRVPPDAGLLRGVFDKLGFKSLMNKWSFLDPEQPEEDAPAPAELPPGVGRDVKGIWRGDLEAGRALTPLAADAPLAAWVLGRPETDWEEMKARMTGEGVYPLYRDVEMPLCEVLAHMEFTGVAVDREKLAAFRDRLEAGLEGCKAAAAEILGREVNLLSPKQLGALLFEELCLPHGKKVKTGWSTDADTLEALRDAHPIVPVILETRMLGKLKSTYADGLLAASERDGKVRSTFRMTGTVTGRLSSTEPNLQNIPVRQELGATLREMFVPSEPGWVLADADYSQIELRVLAHIAPDETMREAFASGADIHTATAARVFGVPPGEVTPLMRRNAKAVNFGIVYGISDFSLAGDIGVTRAEARAYIDSYLEKYSGVRSYMKAVVESAYADGYVKTLFGRRRYLPELRSKNHHIRSFGERAALNAPIQGTAADIIKMAMVAVFNRIRREGLEARLVLQVHDELIAECPAGEAETVKTLLREEMENVFQLNPKLVAEAHAGGNWADAKG